MVGHDLTLHQGTDRYLRSIQAGEGCDLASAGLLQQNGQTPGFRLADGHLAALGQRLAGAGLQLSLQTVGLQQAQHQLELLASLAHGNHLGLRRLPRAQQTRLSLGEAQQFAGHGSLDRLGSSDGLRAETIDFSHDCIQP